MSVSWLASEFGSKVGFETMARMAPVRRVDRDDRALVVAERIPCRLLRDGIDRQFHRRALRTLAGDDRVHLVEELLVRPPAQVVVECALDAGRLAEQRDDIP